MKGENQAETEQQHQQQQHHQQQHQQEKIQQQEQIQLHNQDRFEGLPKSDERRVRFADSLGMELVTVILFEREPMMLEDLGLGLRYRTRFRYGPFKEIY